jgi:hypothetical protein
MSRLQSRLAEGIMRTINVRLLLVLPVDWAAAWAPSLDSPVAAGVVGPTV